VAARARPRREGGRRDAAGNGGVGQDAAPAAPAVDTQPEAATTAESNGSEG
jgi:hypothetical protein